MMKNKAIQSVLAIILVIPILFSFTSTSSVEAASTKTAYVEVNSGVLNVRSSASTKSKIVGALKNKTKVTVYSVTNGWAKIKFKNKNSYVSNQYLRYTAPSTKAKVTKKTYNSKSFLPYPQISGLKSTTAQKKINTVLSKHIQGSYKGYLALNKGIQECKKDSMYQEYPYMCNYTYQTSYNVKYNSNEKLSILIFDYMYTGGAHGLGQVTAYNFNLNTGNEYTISHILTTYAKYTQVTKYAKNYMIKHADIFFADDITLDDFKVNKNSQFYFTSNGIYLIFQEYEVAPYAAGNPIIKIPSYVYR